MHAFFCSGEQKTSISLTQAKKIRRPVVVEMSI